MGVYLRPTVDDLVFQVFGRPLHPELFDIVATRKVKREGYELNVRITSTGHVITWNNGKLHLTEVTCSSEPQLPERGCLMNFRLRSEQTRSLTCGYGIRYEMSYQVEVLPPEIFLHVHDEILADGSKRGLLHHFNGHNRLTVSPVGFIQADARDGCLCLSSFHTFPSEHTVIKTQSLIEQCE